MIAPFIYGNTAPLHLRPSPDIFRRSVGSKSLTCTKHACTFQTLPRQKISRRMLSLNGAVLPYLYSWELEMGRHWCVCRGRRPRRPVGHRRNQLAFTILTIACLLCRCSAGPGCPLPCNEPVPRRIFSIVPYSPGKIHPAGKKLLLSVKSMEKRLKTGTFCDTINLYQNECTARRRGLHLHTDTTILGGKHHECSRDHGTAQRIFL